LTFDLDILTHPEQGKKHVLPVNLAQIGSAIPEIFEAQPKKVTDGAKNRTLLACGKYITSKAYGTDE